MRTYILPTIISLKKRLLYIINELNIYKMTSYTAETLGNSSKTYTFIEKLPYEKEVFSQ